MNMRVDEPGHTRATLQIHHSCASSVILEYAFAVSERDDLAAANRQRLNLRAFIFNSENGTAEKDSAMLFRATVLVAIQRARLEACFSRHLIPTTHSSSEVPRFAAVNRDRRERYGQS